MIVKSSSSKLSFGLKKLLMTCGCFLAAASCASCAFLPVSQRDRVGSQRIPSSAASTSEPVSTTQTPANFVAVSTEIYRGGRIESQQTAENLTSRYSIKTVIDLQGGDYNDPEMIKKVGADLYHKIENISDLGESPEEIEKEKKQWVASGINPRNFHSFPLDAVAAVGSDEKAKIDRALQILTDPSTPRPIYIHCTHGIDRTGLLIALYRVRNDHWSPKKAHDEMVCLGHDPDPNSPNRFMDDYFFEQMAPENPVNSEYAASRKAPKPGVFGDDEITPVYEAKSASTQVFTGSYIRSSSMAREIARGLKIKTVINLEGGDYNNAELIGLYSEKIWHRYEDKLDAGASPQAIEKEDEELQTAASSNRISYYNIPLSLSSGIPEAQIQRVLTLISAPETARPIYIHASRSKLWTNFIISLYRFKHGGWTPSAAHKELMDGGFDPHMLAAFESYFSKQAGGDYKPAEDTYSKVQSCADFERE